MNHSQVDKFVNRSKLVINQSPQMDEANTKAKIIQPLIDYLGWDINSSVELEYPLQIGSRSSKVDYALLIENTPLVFVEAKGADMEIKKRDKGQLRSYMRQKGVNWGILTNGKRFIFLKRKKGVERPKEVELGDYTLEDLRKNIKTLEIFSKEKIENGESEKIAERIEKIQESVEELENKKEEISRKIQKSLSNEIKNIPSNKIKEQSEEFIDNLIKSLETQTPFKPLSPEAKTEIQELERGSWNPGKNKNAISGKINRKSIQGSLESTVAVFPSHKSGVNFLKENNAWGFVRLGREPKYASIYLTNEKRVKYFAEVDKIVPANKAKIARSPDNYIEKARFDPNKKVIFFKTNTLKELTDPIPYKEKAPQGHIYTTLKKFKAAKTTVDLY